MLVEDPGAVTPIFIPFRSAGDLYFSAFALLITSSIAEYLPCRKISSMFWPFACCVMVCRTHPK